MSAELYCYWVSTGTTAVPPSIWRQRCIPTGLLELSQGNTWIVLHGNFSTDDLYRLDTLEEAKELAEHLTKAAWGGCYRL